jgi:hypothetical protein
MTAMLIIFAAVIFSVAFGAALAHFTPDGEDAWS